MPQRLVKDHLSNIQFEYFGDLTIYKVITIFLILLVESLHGVVGKS